MDFIKYFSVNRTNILAKAVVVTILLVIVLSCLATEARAVYGIDPSIKQVKTADSPIVYYLDHKRGMKKAYVSEQAYLAYGNKWSDIKIISQKELDKWPDIHLVKTDGNAKVFYINNGKKAWIESEQQFIDLGFKWSDIVTIARADLDSYQLTSYERIKVAASTPLSQDNGAASDNSGLLQVSLDDSSPSTAYIPTGSRGNTVTVLKFQTRKENVRIHSLTLTRQGVTSDKIIKAVYLEDETGRMHGYKVGLSNKQAYINFGSEPIEIASNQTKIMLVKVDLNPGSNVVNNTISLGILNSVDINTDVAISGNFPVMGAEHKLVDGNNYLGRLKVSSITLNSSIKTVNVGSQEESIASFRFSEISGNEDIVIRKIVLTNIGSSYDEDLRNIRLVDHDGDLIMKVQTPINKKVSFELPGGYWLRKGHYANFTIKLDIVGGSGRDVKFVINSEDDIGVNSLNNGYGLIVESNKGFPIGNACGNDCNRIIIEHQPLFVTAKSLDEDKLKVYSDQYDAIIGLFELHNNVSDIRIKNITASVMTSSGAPVLDSAVYLVEADSGYEISSIDGERITNTAAELRLSNYQIAPQDTFTFAFITHIPDTADGGDTYYVYIKDISYYIAQDNQLHTDTFKIYGQQWRVAEPSVYLFAGEFQDKDLAVAGDSKVKLGTFKIEATSEEKIKITSITISNASGYAPITYNYGFSNLALYKGNSRISDYIYQPTASSYTFNGLRLTVRAGKSIELNIKADIAAGASGEVKVVLENVIAQGYYSGVSAVINNKGIESPAVSLSQTVLAVQAVSGGNITAAKADNIIASFTFTNQAAEIIKLHYVTIVTIGCNGGLSASNGFSDLKFGYEQTDGEIKRVGSRISSPVAKSNRISLGGYKLAIGESITLNLYVDASEHVNACTMGLYLRDIEAEGYISKIDANIIGDPTKTATVVCN